MGLDAVSRAPDVADVVHLGQVTTRLAQQLLALQAARHRVVPLHLGQRCLDLRAPSPHRPALAKFCIRDD